MTSLVCKRLPCCQWHGCQVAGQLWKLGYIQSLYDWNTAEQLSHNKQKIEQTNIIQFVHLWLQSHAEFKHFSYVVLALLSPAGNKYFISIVLALLSLAEKKIPESTEGFSRWKVEKRHAKFGKTGLNNWNIHKSQKGQNQVSERVSVPCWHATPVANAPWELQVIQ